MCGLRPRHLRAFLNGFLNNFLNVCSAAWLVSTPLIPHAPATLSSFSARPQVLKAISSTATEALLGESEVYEVLVALQVGVRWWCHRYIPVLGTARHGCSCTAHGQGHKCFSVGLVYVALLEHGQAHQP